MTEDDMSRSQRNRSAGATASRSGRQRGPKKKHLWRDVAIIAATLGALGLVAGGGLFAYYASSAPRISDSALHGTSQTQLLDSTGKTFYTTGNQTREVARQAEIPKILRQAVTSIEDRRFYKHHGVDPRRILGATVANITGSSLGLQGGSTLTQQLVKLTVFSTSAADQTLKRKAQEAYLATQVEKKYSKDQILTLYMNKVYMGNGVYGMKTAANYYFGKELDQLTVPQIALIAGLPQSPSGYDPYTNPKGALARRNNVIRAMQENKVISKADADRYVKVPINQGLKETHPETEKAEKDAKETDAYITSTLQELRRLGYDPAKDGLRVHTNLNSKVQKRAYDIANSDQYVIWPSDDLQVGLTVTNPNNGKVMAQIGGRKLDTTFGLNRAKQTSRSSGSTAKPLVDYGPAVEHLNWPTYRTVDDSPYTYPGTNVKVYDWDHKFEGKMTMRQALAESRNIPAIKTFVDVGNQNAAGFLDKLGIKVKASDLVTSNAIGIDVSSEQEAAAYSAFGNGGTYYKPYYISSVEEQSGDIKKFSPEGKEAMKSSTAFMLTNMMESVITDSYAKMVDTNAYSQAGKTGVTGYADDADVPDGAASDTWFTGLTKSATISVWTGYDEPNTPGHYLAKGSDQYLALKTYGALMDYIMQGGGLSDADGSDWTVPETVKQVTKYGKTEYEVRGASFKNPPLHKTFPSSEFSSSATSSSSAALRSSSTTSVLRSSSSQPQPQPNNQQEPTNPGGQNNNNQQAPQRGQGTQTTPPSQHPQSSDSQQSR
ncbi:transglycosylase domain-containing protein [Weissella halotolerans]|uniref:Membrane carboxypeptidase (Penicillin-binding protein) n=1 Tax=Weissella halotolerans DSM 20190 TaxID=1123500 RepID=A0A0R2G259_9LACO|nr:transglycosylase domain-containing protein [Weissella halotolerans]KRN33574.1 membrane carboxypeptidase (penicillin-binding protein) [Weissella halotolerans DSM 20190]